jgi:anti-sigma B factor antagonist
MANEALTIEKSEETESGAEILRLTGPVTLATVFELQDALRLIGKSKVIIDVSAVPYMDSAGLGALLAFHVSCSRHNRQYRLSGVAPRVHTMLQVAKVDEVLNLAPSVHIAAEELR